MEEEGEVRLSETALTHPLAWRLRALEPSEQEMAGWWQVASRGLGSGACVVFTVFSFSRH